MGSFIYSLSELRPLIPVFFQISVQAGRHGGRCMVTKIERKAMISYRYNYPTPPIRNIKRKETQTRNNWTLMEKSLAESQTDSYFPIKWPNGYPKTKRCKRHTHSKTNYKKINHDRRTALKRSVKSIHWGA